MTRKRNNKGFSLVELIIVIAILAVLVALVAPQFFQYVEKSRKGVCVNNRDEVRRQYVAALIMSKADGDGKENADILKDVMLQSGGEKDGNGYTGICPSSGAKVSGKFDEAGNVTLTCSVHGEEHEERAEQKNIADAISEIVQDETVKYSITLKERMKVKMDSPYKSSYASVDSESGNGDWYKKIALKLKDAGIDTANQSWILQGAGDGGYVVAVTTDGKITDKAKQTVDIVKYTYTADGVCTETEETTAYVQQKWRTESAQHNYNWLFLDKEKYSNETNPKCYT